MTPALLWQAVEPAVGRDGVIDHRLRVRLFRDVGPDERGLTAGRSHELDGLGAGRLRVLGDDDLAALGGEHLGGHATHPTTATGDDRDLVLESHRGPSRRGASE
jgi:hypothetical protein